MAPGARCTLLIRANSPAALQGRLEKLQAFCNIDSSTPIAVDAVAGDITQPRFGLDHSTRNELFAKTTHVIHSAGNVHLDLPEAVANAHALGSADEIVALCRDFKNIRKVEFVSTVGVAGHTSGDIPETWIERDRKFHNTYEAAKAAAEKVVRVAIDQGHPITVHRPSMVVGDSRDGVNISFQVFYYLCEFLSGSRSSGVLPNIKGFYLDTIPCDYVAAAIVASSLNGESIGRVFHLSAGREGAYELTDLSRDVRKIFAENGRKVPVLFFLPLPVYSFVLRGLRLIVDERAKRALTQLPLFLAYLAERQFFQSIETRRTLETWGVTLPPTPSYLNKILGYYLQEKQRRKK